MIARHNITAFISGHYLKITDAKITLDDAWAPYCQATLVCALPAAAVLAAIDPRNFDPIEITVTRDVGGQRRVFWLVLVDRVVDQKAATLTLVCASGEQHLMDLARTATTVDTSARTHQASLRAILNNVVLPTITPSTQLVPASRPLRYNRALNPRVHVDTSNWWSGGTIARTSHDGRWWATAEPGIYTYAQATGVIGSHYAASLLVRGAPGTSFTVVSTDSVAGSWVAALGWLTIPASGEVRVSVPAAAPVANSWLLLGIGLPTAAVFVTEVLIEEVLGPGEPVKGPYFDGSTLVDSGYGCSWTGAADASISMYAEVNPTPDWNATPGVTGGDVTALDWPPGRTAWDFIAPLIQASGLRLYCDELGAWRLVDPAAAVPGAVNITQGVNLTDGRESISRTRDWFDSVVVSYKWNDAAGVSHQAYDAAAPLSPIKTHVVEVDRPYPGVGAAAAILTRASGRGRVFELRALSDYAVKPGQAITATLPDTPVQTGLVSSVTWRLPDDQMDVRSKGLVTTPPTSWLALSSTETWLDSPVGGTWIGE